MGASGVQRGGQIDEQLRRRARSYVYERMALASSAIWVLGAFILMTTIVPYVPHPQVYIAIASTVPIPFAALPWIFYRRISDAVARRWAESGETR
ncbi:MAG TPA: hypothetical protein VFC51_14235 [Chloroflexota bacterium]|nr:hypothetical protein [Chloroflexota bacterium]